MKPTAQVVTDSRGKHFNQEAFCDKKLFHEIEVIAISGAQVYGIKKGACCILEPYLHRKWCTRRLKSTKIAFAYEFSGF